MRLTNNNYFRGFLFLFLVLGTTYLGFPQSGLKMSVSGFAREAHSLSPLPGIEIIIYQMDEEKLTMKRYLTATSDIKGFFKIRYLAPGLYKYRIKIPKIGEMRAIGLEARNFDELEIHEGKNINMNVLLAEQEIDSYPVFEKKVSPDKRIINLKILYYNFLSERKRKNLDAKLFYGLSEIRESEGLTFVREEIFVEDDRVLRDLEAEECSSVLIFWEPIIKCEEVVCEESDEGCRCLFFNLRCIFPVTLYVHKKSYFKKQYEVGSENCIDCIVDCVYNHEDYHNTQMVKFIEKEWASIKLNLKRAVKPYCCSNTKECKKVCLEKLLFYKAVFKEKIKEFGPETEADAVQLYKKCIKEQCKKIPTCEDAKNR